MKTKFNDVVVTLLIGGLLTSLVLLLLPAAGPPPAPPERETLVNGVPVFANPAKGLSWRFERDDDGVITKVVDPAGRQTRILRVLKGDRLQRLVKELPDGSKVEHEFDHLGRAAAAAPR